MISPVLDGGARWQHLRPVIGTALRIFMGTLFVFAGYTKIVDIELSQLSVKAYELFPNAVANFIGVALPVLEIVLGLLLLIGFGTRVVAGLMSVMLIAFIAGIASLWIRGIDTACGCFGGSLLAQGPPNFGLEIFRDVLMLLATAWLVIWPVTQLSVDGMLARRASLIDDEPYDEDESQGELVDSTRA